MTIFGLIVFIIVVGVILGVFNQLVPMAGSIKSLLNILVLVVMIVYILQFFGIVKPVLPIPRFFNF